MLTKIALAAALVLGSAGAVLANDTDHNDVGGFHLGPLGQEMGGSAVNPAYHRSLRGTAANASTACAPNIKSYVGIDGVRHQCR
jgi:hypothetical protein